MFCIGARASVPGFSSTPSSIIFVWLLSVPLVKIDVNCPIPPLEVILIELIELNNSCMSAKPLVSISELVNTSIDAGEVWISIGEIELPTTIGFNVSLACVRLKNVNRTFNKIIFLKFIIYPHLD